MDWIVGDADAKQFIMWLYGDAGAGKSTIGQTLALRCAEQKILLGSFFFSRSDARRSTINALVATIAYQAATIFTTLKKGIVAAIDRDPLIFSKSLVGLSRGHETYFTTVDAKMNWPDDFHTSVSTTSSPGQPSRMWCFIG